MRHHELRAGDSSIQLDVPAAGRPALCILGDGKAASALLSRPDAIAVRDWLNEWLGDTTLPGPTSVGGEPRRLTRQERIEARHWLQVLSEQARTVRDAMHPETGVPAITDRTWAGQWAALRKDLDDFTGRVQRGEAAATASPGAFQDRNG